MNHKPLRVGLDMDGVILYNPARIIRPVVATSKQILGIGKSKKSPTTFYKPKKPLEQKLFRLFHRSSICTAPGYKIIELLIEQGLIEAYIITARFDYLKKDIDTWVSRHNADAYFKDIIHNKHNQQPHIYKSNMVNDLDLDIYVEDNWDIVAYMNKHKQKASLEVLWISNLIDMLFIPYEHRYLRFQSAAQYIQQRCMEK